MSVPLEPPQQDLIPALPVDVALDCLLRVPVDGHAALRQVCASWRAAASHPSFAAERRRRGYVRSYACFLQAQALAPGSGPGSGGRKAPVYGITLYDPALASWSTLPPIPDFADLGLPIFCQCVAAGPRLVVLGGWHPVTWSVLTSVYIYDFAARSWRRGADMPSARSFFAAAAAAAADGGGGAVLVAGGHDPDKNALRSAHLYRVAADAWEALPDMNEQRDECAAAALPGGGGGFVVVSGFSTESQGQFVASAEVYKPGAGAWAVLDAAWPAGKPPSSVLSIRGQLHAFLDGNLAAFQPADPEAAAADRRRPSWKTLAAIPAELSVVSSAASLGDAGVLVCGYSGRADEPWEAFTCSTLAPANNGGGGGGTTTAAPSPWRKVINSEHGLCGLAQSSCTVQV